MKPAPTRILLIVGVVVVAGTAGFVGGYVRGGIDPVDPVPSAAASGATTTVPVRIATLSVSGSAIGTLGHGAADWPLVNQLAGIVTDERPIGAICAQASALYSVGAEQVYLTIGPVPQWRSVQVGTSGPDVLEVKSTLSALGAGQLSEGRTFLSADALRVSAWRKAHGLAADGGDIPFGEFIAEPAAVRIEADTVPTGEEIGPGQQALAVSSTQRIALVNAPASVASNLTVGTQVSVAAGSASVNGSVEGFMPPDASQSGGDAPDTLGVIVDLSGSSALSEPDGASVTVSFTTERVSNVLAVPISALLALAEGGYGVDEALPGGKNELVGVTIGLIDDTQELVQVSGPQIRAGVEVLVPAT